MAKASTSLLPSENPRNSHIAEQAAAQIVGLINARPSSPRQEEIAAVIAKAMGSTSPETIAPTARMAGLRTIISAIATIEDAAGGYAKLNDDQQEKIEKLHKPLVRLVQAVWETPMGRAQNRRIDPRRSELRRRTDLSRERCAPASVE